MEQSELEEHVAANELGRQMEEEKRAAAEAKKTSARMRLVAKGISIQDIRDAL